MSGGNHALEFTYTLTFDGLRRAFITITGP